MLENLNSESRFNIILAITLYLSAWQPASLFWCDAVMFTHICSGPCFGPQQSVECNYRTQLTRWRDALT